MPKIKVNDIEMYYEIHGQGEPLVLIAGFSVDHTAWQAVIDGFAKHYQVIVFDNRGAGQTDVPDGPYSVDQLAEDVVALCQVLCIKKAHFVGNSMGGYILQTLAYRHSHLVQSAVICNSTFVAHTCFQYFMAAQLELMQANAPMAALLKASCCWAFSYQFLSQPGMLEGLIDLGLNHPYPFTMVGHKAQRVAIDQFDSRDWIGKIKVPTLVIGADQDLIFSEPSIKALAEKISHAEYYCFKECGHLPHIEYPQEFAKVVSKFIKEI